MKQFVIVATLMAIVSMVMVMAFTHCPKGCEYPSSKEDCLKCLNDGYSSVVKGTQPGDFKGVSKKLEEGAWIDWDGSRCWIHLKGIDSKKDCRAVANEIFGNELCVGFQAIDWRALTRRCWVKFKKVDETHVV